MDFARRAAQRVARPAAALRCPTDWASLYDDGETVRCPDCGAVYRTRASEPVDFIGDSVAETAHVTTSSARASRSADGPGGSIAHAFTPDDSVARIEPTLVDWRLALAISRSHRVLVVGSGWGRLAFTLAPWVGHLYSLETVAPQIQYQQIMLEQRRDANVTLIKGSLRQLEFRPATLDWVVFHGVVERFGRAGAKGSSGPAVNALRQALDALKPGGRILLIGPNRWGISRYSTHSESQASTHGLNDYTSLLQDAGSVDITVSALMPHMNRPRAIIPISPPCSASAQKFAVQQIWKRASLMGALTRGAVSLLVNVGLMRQFYPYYMAVGSKA